jgi:hypothetical protein
MSEWINDPSDAPTIWLVIDGPDNRRSGCDGALENGVRIVDDHHHSR